jgi:hypothetical protein
MDSLSWCTPGVCAYHPWAEFSIDGKTLSKLADLGVEKKEDMTYMTEEVC